MYLQYKRTLAVWAMTLTFFAVTPRSSHGKKRPKAPSLASQTLRCARVSFQTDGDDWSAVDATVAAPEGGGIAVKTWGDYTHATVHYLGESIRFRYDLRFIGEELVCASVESTSLVTIYEATETNKGEGYYPPTWRRDEYIFAGKKVLSHEVDEAPGKDERHANLKDVRENAALVLRALSNQNGGK